MSLFSELTRRNVTRVAMACVVAAWLIIQVVETILPAYGMGDAAIRVAVSILAVDFLPVLVFSWAFEITPEGLNREPARPASATASSTSSAPVILMRLSGSQSKEPVRNSSQDGEIEK